MWDFKKIIYTYSSKFAFAFGNRLSLKKEWLMQIHVYYKHHLHIFLSAGFFQLEENYCTMLCRFPQHWHIDKYHFTFVTQDLRPFLWKYQTYRRMSKYLSSFYSALSDIKTFSPIDLKHKFGTRLHICFWFHEEQLKSLQESLPSPRAAVLACQVASVVSNSATLWT